MSSLREALREARDYIQHKAQRHDLNWRDGNIIIQKIDAALSEQSGEPDIGGPDFLRISKSGYSLRVGWGDDKRIVARSPEHDTTLQQWLIDAERLCDGWNRVHPPSGDRNRVIDKLKKDLSLTLMAAVNGTDESLRYEKDYIR